MKKPFGRTGSKTYQMLDIVKKIPVHTTYVEPFVGSGAVYFKKEPSTLEVINDIDEELMYHYRLIMECFYNGEDLPENYDLETLKEYIKTSPENPLEELAHYIIKTCNGFAGKVGILYKDTNPFNKLRNIEIYKKRLQNTIILNNSYEDVINEFDSPDTFFYLDPPYENSKRLYNSYIVDYEDMASRLKNIKGKFLLSINDSSYIRKVFEGFNFEEYIVSPKNGIAIGRESRDELYISNYSY